MFSVGFSPADDLSSQDQFEVPEAGGWDATLNGEDEDDFFDLQIVKHYDGEVMVERKCMVFFWELLANYGNHLINWFCFSIPCR